MAAETHEAIVLRGRNVGEADKLITLFTRSRGKVVVSVKGIRRSTAKLTGYLEPFSFVTAEIFFGRGQPRLIGVELINRFVIEQEALFSISVKFFLVELVDSLFRDLDPHPRVLTGLVEALSALARRSDGRPIIVFALLVLREAGIAPRVSHCVECQQKRTLFHLFSIHEGGVVCERCHVPDSMAISPEVITALQLDRLPNQQQAFTELSQLVTTFLYHQLGAEPKSTPILRRLSQLAVPSK